ncbi:WD40-repeat-containing domain protein [Chiua virens]|nr:WD40-repeat-containing domain protein [Chiua virens]
MSLIKKLWTTKDGAKPVQIQAYGEVYSVAFSPLVDAKHGQCVVGGGQSKALGRWRVDDGRAVEAPIGVSSYLLNITVSKDGRLIACGGSNGLAAVWDVQTHRTVVKPDVDGGQVCAVDLSPDATMFATGAHKNMCVWSVQDAGRLCLGPLKHTYSVAAVKFSPSGDRIATATWERDSIRLYDSTNGQLLADIRERVSSPYNTSLVWSHDGRQLYASSNAGKIKCFHLSGSMLSWAEWNAVQADNRPTAIALASNGKFVATASYRFISFWDTSTHVQIGPIIDHAERVWSIAISEDGCLACGGDDKKITLRNLRDILPRFYFLDPSDSASQSQVSLQSSVSQQSTSLAEVRRLEKLLHERDKVIQESGIKRQSLEQTVQNLSTALRTQGKNLDQLKQETTHLKATVRDLRNRLSDAQVTTKKLRSECKQLAKQLSKTYEHADQHRLQVERIQTTLDELKVQQDIDEHQEAQSGSQQPRKDDSTETVGESPRSRKRGTSIDGIKNYSHTDSNALACRAFIFARSQNWNAAFDEAQKSISAQPSAIGHIAKAVALVGQGDYRAALRAFALVFRDGNPDENEFALVIWAVLSCVTGEYIDGVLRMHDLVDATKSDLKPTYDYIQAYMYVLLGNKSIKEKDYERAIQLFCLAQTPCLSQEHPRLELTSLISGWSFDGLESMAQQRLYEALDAVDRTKDADKSPP